MKNINNCRVISVVFMTAIFLLLNISIVSAVNRADIEIEKKRPGSVKAITTKSLTKTQIETGEQISRSETGGITLFENKAISSNLITASLLSGGGRSGSSSSFRLSSSISQFAVGSGSNSANGAEHGFWYVIDGLAAPASCCGLFTGGLTGNINCDTQGRRGIEDITLLIDHVYIRRADLCCLANGNLDQDDAGLINLSDITRLIDHVYISKAETEVCR